MKTIATVFAISALTAGASFAQDNNPNREAVFDYPTMAGMNEGLTQQQFDEYDGDADGLLNPDEQMRFMEDGYTNESPVEQIAEPTDGFQTDSGTDD
ncbi:hypothetical protein PARPLA_01762 [Rhodobacteraceae bacterium THAF1]|uniref:hypothetical protein n=1 Tax=Palleronia sp. THAF1 TaxID=2587842 RepID=UPI000F3ACE8E|nr:hypothetical protein [Palleronia sp. THAF1]QFU09103.1 hypothetical protein FIU81_10495 [Palleronia sp. THAF1]VDC24089.1 hypothetical protein PARPLA_01762 [Rhodobacteraceae bacterium THAF1]